MHYSTNNTKIQYKFIIHNLPNSTNNTNHQNPYTNTNILHTTKIHNYNIQQNTKNVLKYQKVQNTKSTKYKHATKYPDYNITTETYPNVLNNTQNTPNTQNVHLKCNKEITPYAKIILNNTTYNKTQ